MSRIQGAEQSYIRSELVLAGSFLYCATLPRVGFQENQRIACPSKSIPHTARLKPTFEPALTEFSQHKMYIIRQIKKYISGSIIR